MSGVAFAAQSNPADQAGGGSGVSEACAVLADDMGADHVAAAIRQLDFGDK
jgi:hypothetical protein